MPINGASFPEGATVSSTGGTAKSLTTDSKPVKNGIHVIDASVTDYASRPNAFFTCVQPQYDPTTKSYSNAKKQARCYFPKVDAQGNLKLPGFDIRLNDNPCQTPAEITKMRQWLVQFATDPDFDSFWTVGTTA